jgi:hypothetical protein
MAASMVNLGHIVNQSAGIWITPSKMQQCNMFVLTKCTSQFSEGIHRRKWICLPKEGKFEPCSDLGGVRDGVGAEALEAMTGKSVRLPATAVEIPNILRMVGEAHLQVLLGGA